MESRIRAAIITLSDKGSKGERQDESGRLISEMLATINALVVHYAILPDEKTLIIDSLTGLSDTGEVDLVLTTGGTGVVMMSRRADTSGCVNRACLARTRSSRP